MSRVVATTWRPIAVWLAVGLAAAGAVAVVPGAWQAVRVSPGSDVVPAVLVAGCATGLAAAAGWVWLVTTATVVGVLRGRVTSRGATRRLVLLACGAAVVAASGTPALAASGDGSELLVGLPLPERAVAPAAPQQRTAPTAHDVAGPVGAVADTYVVRPGDSLWSIARSHPTGVSTDERWRAIWAANRDLVGEDPDLIHPGQALRLPGPHAGPHADPHADKDGDR